MLTQSPSRVAVVIASTGRPVELGRWVDHMRRQTVQPAALVYAVAKVTDLPCPEDIREAVTVVISDPGLPRQRNAGLEAVSESSDIIVYFDDDYVPSSYCIEGIDVWFRRNQDIVAANGFLLADGINTAGISYEEAARIVSCQDALPRSEPTVLCELNGLYGCNMAYRIAAIGSERFDEQLPLYGWQEDVDFATRVGRRGRIVKTNAFYGVHQGIKGARLPGLRLGYSQVVNPIYLARKGTLSISEAAKLVVKNMLMNHVRALLPERWVDRFGRCKGNWLAVRDVLLRRDHPGNILRL